MKPVSILIFLTIVLTGCGNKYEYWNISKFLIVNDALEDGEEIKVLYTSRGPDHNPNLEYYYHIIAVSQKTGDTVNILTVAESGPTLDDKDKVFSFFDQTDFESKIVQMELEHIKDIKHIDDFDKMEKRKIDRVARDPKFDYLADNGYPTIIGSVGTRANKE